MNILAVHNSYLSRGGEDEVFDSETTLLESKGHRVERCKVEADRLFNPSVRAKLGLAKQAVWSHDSYRQIRQVIRATAPDVVHFHNTFPLISPSAYVACQDAGVPVVQTLHNYRLLCPNVLLFRNGRPCEECLGKTFPWPGTFHACYHGSRAQTAVISTMLAFHNVRGTWVRDIDRYIVLSAFAREKFAAGGLPREKLKVKPNFYGPDPGVPENASRSFFISVGRLSDEKGTSTLLDAWTQMETALPLHIIGEGPDEPQVREAALRQPLVRYLGRRPRAEVLDQIANARALISAAQSYETFGLVAIEAFSRGTPVVVSRHGAIAELVDDGRTGLLFDPNDPSDLAEKVRWAWDHPEEMQQMGLEARREYENSYTPDRNYPMLMEIYQEAISSSRQRHTTRRGHHLMSMPEGTST